MSAAARVLSVDEAESEGETWLDWLVHHGEHSWVPVSTVTLRAQPTPDLPCTLHMAVAEVTTGGYAPYLMLMAGKKRTNRYWQHVTRDPVTHAPHPRDRALADINNLVSALARLSSVPHKYPTRRLLPSEAPDHSA